MAAAPAETEKILLDEESWLVLRTGRIEEVHHDNGRIIYRVKVWDAGRDAFVTQNFNDEGPAYGFRDRIRDDNSRFVLDYENGKVKNNE